MSGRFSSGCSEWPLEEERTLDFQQLPDEERSLELEVRRLLEEKWRRL